MSAFSSVRKEERRSVFLEPRSVGPEEKSWQADDRAWAKAQM